MIRCRSFACALALAVAIPLTAQQTLAPSATTLTPGRVRLATDTIALLISFPDSGEHLSSTLIRRVERIGSVLRETQRYESHEKSRPGISYDTLDVDAASLAPLRNVFIGRGLSYDLRFSQLQMEGTMTSPDSGTRPVHAVAHEPFFPSMMQESFTAAFPYEADRAIAIRMGNPPDTTVRTSQFAFERRETIRTADGPVPSLLYTTSQRHVELWISEADGRLMRMHWSTPNGMSVWKLPARDASFRDAVTK
jgi:hypothetical protein